MEIILKNFDLHHVGSGFMWFILFVGLASLGLVIERVIYIYFKAGKGRKEFLANVAILVKDGKYDEAERLSASTPIPVAKSIHAILSNRKEGAKKMDEAFEEVYMTEAPRMTRYLTLIMVIANVATLLGLLGTLWGLIHAFNAVANLPAADRPKALTDAISAKMGITFMGLSVAIPLMVCYGFLSMQAERMVQEMEEKSAKVKNKILESIKA
jgi:biopolymer transport protein ExbB